MVEWSLVNGRFLFNIKGHHEIDLNLMSALPNRANVLINIFTFRYKSALVLKTQ